MSRGFDAIIGNPPWVLFAGKGKGPIEADEEAALKELFGRAAKMLSTHGAFACQAGRLLRPRGRAGLVLPTSLADASRYGETRAAHEEVCEVDRKLPDFGEDAFVGVFQPSFGLLSTRRAQPLAPKSATGAAWDLHQAGVDPRARALLAKLAGRPTLPPELFGERGYRSSKGHEGTMFKKGSSSAPPFTVPLYEGTSVRELELLAPTAFADPDQLDEVTRTDKWTTVAVYIRQTARYPIACLSAGKAFRNSILAGFARAGFSAGFLVAYLNSAPVRWFHYHAQRDAQQGMPQVKIAHLRALPAPAPEMVAPIAAIGDTLGSRGTGLTETERHELDALVSRALELGAEESCFVVGWARRNPPPAPRGAETAGREQSPAFGPRKAGTRGPGIVRSRDDERSRKAGASTA